MLFWLNCWVFVYELSGCGFESSCSHLNFRFHVCFEQGVPWHSGNYRVWIHSETRTWHDKNIQSDELFLQNGWLRFIFSRNDCYRLSPQQTFDRCSDYYYSISAQLHSTKLAIRLCECSNPAARSKSQFW